MRCPFCQGTDSRKKWRKAGFDFLACRGCGLIYIDPIPSEAELAKYYEEEFFAGPAAGYVDYEREQAWRSKNYRRDVKTIEELVSPGRLLDVGCATGHFMDACPEHWEKHGQEVSEYAGAEARKNYGDRIQVAALGDCRYEDDSFDVVTVWETINHMLDPFADLRTIHRVLRVGGVVAISVGDIHSLLARVMGRYWYHVTPPVHIWYFTGKTMRAILEATGFEVAKLHYPGKYVDLATSFERVRDTTSSPLLTKVCRGLGALPWGRIQLYINLRDTMYVFARKRG